VDLSSDDKRALGDFCARVRTRFQDRVREIALFGSRARDDAREDSDIDVCVVIDDLTFEEQRDIDAITAAVLETDGVWLSPFLVSTAHMEHLRRRERAIALEIAKDGIRL
jgi:predicted nucleotidyltransferase